MDDRTVLLQYEGVNVGCPISPAFTKFICLLIEPEQIELSETKPPCYQIVNMVNIEQTTLV